MPTNEERIEWLEQSHAAHHAHAYAIGIVQTDVAALREDIARVDGKVDDLRTEMDGKFAEVNGKLDAILARLDRR